VPQWFSQQERSLLNFARMKTVVQQPAQVAMTQNPCQVLFFTIPVRVNRALLIKGHSSEHVQGDFCLRTQRGSFPDGCSILQ
jgi:hypothetical protein